MNKRLIKSDSPGDVNIYVEIDTIVFVGDPIENDSSDNNIDDGTDDNGSLHPHPHPSPHLPSHPNPQPNPHPSIVAKKRLVPDIPTLQILQLSLGAVQTISSSTFNSMTTDVPCPKLTVNSLIRSNNSSLGFLLTSTGKKAIPDQVTFNALGFSSTNYNIIDDETINLIISLPPFPSRIDNTLLKTGAANSIYIMTNLQKHLIPDNNTLIAMQLDTKPIYTCLDVDFQSIPLGAPLPAISFASSFPITAVQGNEINTGEPGVVGHMKTTVTLDIHGLLQANTHTFITNHVFGFTGGVVAVLLDANKSIIGQTDVHQYGVSAMPFFENQPPPNPNDTGLVPWTYQFDRSLLPLVASIEIMQFYDPKAIPINPLEAILYIAGFAYDPVQDIIYSRIDALQRKFGYAYGYDNAALLMSAVIDCEPIFFNYNGKEWMIELWKGQYGLETGCEIGIYNRNPNDKGGLYGALDTVLGTRAHDAIPSHNLFYNCAGDDEMLQMSYILYRDGEKIFTRESPKHWWLTGFKWGIYSEPEQLKMEIAITFQNTDMQNAFVNALRGMNYAVTVSNQQVSFIFDKPTTYQPRLSNPLLPAVKLNNQTIVATYTGFHFPNNDPSQISSHAWEIIEAFLFSYSRFLSTVLANNNLEPLG